MLQSLRSTGNFGSLGKKSLKRGSQPLQHPAVETAVSRIKSELGQRRLTGIDGQNDWFIPPKALEEVLNSDNIKILNEALAFEDSSSDPQLKRQRRDALPEDIIRYKAHDKVAILVDLELTSYIYDFVVHQEPLPLNEEQLQDIGLAPDSCKQVANEQYHYIPENVVMDSVIPKVIDDRRTVPFEKVEAWQEREGAFGKVVEFRYHSSADQVERRVGADAKLSSAVG